MISALNNDKMERFKVLAAIDISLHQDWTTNVENNGLCPEMTRLFRNRCQVLYLYCHFISPPAPVSKWPPDSAFRNRIVHPRWQSRRSRRRSSKRTVIKPTLDILRKTSVWFPLWATCLWYRRSQVKREWFVQGEKYEDLTWFALKRYHFAQAQGRFAHVR